ncbi:MAG: phosphatidylglycerophosphatase A [Bryobacterales bacterium]|nr:phosphatidylglycerophosphatase A [Bryobacterales bacterium]
MKNNPLAIILATWFGCGFSPKAPGTAGALGALPFAWLWLHTVQGPPVWMLLPTVLLTLPSIWAAGRVAAEKGLEDPQIIVVDEVLGAWIAIAGATVLNWKSIALAFLLFRLFDIWKPQPVRWLEGLHGGLGIVADDLMAGVYAAVVLFLAGWFNLY